MAESATPTTPTAKTLSVEDASNKHLAVEKRMSLEKRQVSGSASSEETPTKAIIQHQKRFRGGHESFRLRMFQEQCGFEPVFVTKKRAGKAAMSEFRNPSHYSRQAYTTVNGQEIIGANIETNFGVCGWILTVLSYILICLTLPISACMCVKVVQEYERAVIFRLGRLMPGGAKGPGIFFIVPCIDTYRKVDLRVVSFDVPPQEILSKDSVTVAVDAVVYFRISNATISVTNVEDAARSTKLLAQTTLRNILGTKTLAEMLSDREAISLQMQSTLDEATDPWGVKVERVEVKDVRLPVQLQRAMAAEAEAAREARAKVIAAEGEQKASRALKEAADVISQSPSALQLRYLQTLNSISAEKNSTIIFPLPIDLLSAFLPRQSAKVVEAPPSLPKNIRPCCLHKYPDWVQKLIGREGPPEGWSPSTIGVSGRLPHNHGSSSSSSPLSHQPMLQQMPITLDPGALRPDPRMMGAPRAGKQLKPQISQGSLLKQAIANRLNPHTFKQNELPKPMAITNALDDDYDRKRESAREDKMHPSSPEGSASLESVKSGGAPRDADRDSLLSNAAWHRAGDGSTGVKEKITERVTDHSSVKQSTGNSKGSRTDMLVDAENRREKNPQSGRGGNESLLGMEENRSNVRRISGDSTGNEGFTAVRQGSSKGGKEVKLSSGHRTPQPEMNRNMSNASLYKETSSVPEKGKLHSSRRLASEISEDRSTSENSSAVHQVELAPGIFGGDYVSSSALLREPSDFADNRYASARNSQEDAIQRQASLHSLRRERSRSRVPPNGLSDSAVSLPVHTASGKGWTGGARNHNPSQKRSTTLSRDQTDQANRSGFVEQDSAYRGDDLSTRNSRTGGGRDTESSRKSSTALIRGQADYPSRNRIDEQSGADGSDDLPTTVSKNRFVQDGYEYRAGEQYLGGIQDAGRSTHSLAKVTHSSKHGSTMHQVHDRESEESDRGNSPRYSSEGNYPTDDQRSVEQFRREGKEVGYRNDLVLSEAPSSLSQEGSHGLGNEAWSSMHHAQQDSYEYHEGLEGQQHFPIESQQSIYQEDLLGPDHLMHGDVEEYDGGGDDGHGYFSLDQLPASVREAIEMDIRRGWARDGDALPTPGYMARLHGCDSRTSIDAHSHHLRSDEADSYFPRADEANSYFPRSASGYYEPRNERFTAGYAQAEEDEDDEIVEALPVRQIPFAGSVNDVLLLSDRTAEERLRRGFLNQFGTTHPSAVGARPRLAFESESTPKDPAPSSTAATAGQQNAIRRDSFFESKDSMTSDASRESVMSATSYRAEPRLARHFNY